MNIKEILLKTTDFLKSKNIDTARYESEMIVSTVLGMERMNLYLKFDQPLKKSEIDRCRSYLSDRSKGKPLAYVLGYKDFYTSRFKVNSDVLIPRSETEILVEKSIEFVKENKFTTALEFGVGSGCVGVSLLKDCPEIKYTGVEISQPAIAVIEENFNKNGVTENFEIINSDVKDFFKANSGKKYNLIVSNPPYIDLSDDNIEASVKDFEPGLALFAEEDGLFYLKEWLKIADELISQNGVIIFEMGQGQYDAVKEFAVSLNNDYEISPILDYNEVKRFIELKRK